MVSHHDSQALGVSLCNVFRSNMSLFVEISRSSTVGLEVVSGNDYLDDKNVNL